MPSDTATTSTTTKRLSGSKDHPQAAPVSHSPNDNHGHTHKSGAHKHQRHVVGHKGLGARNPSFGRNLGKINTQAANNEGGPKTTVNGTPLSPRPNKASMKRNQSLALMPKHASHAAGGLRKNHSSGHLHRNTSAKHLSKSHRPEYHRSNSSPHPHKEKEKEKTKRRASPPPPNGRHPSVHFDMGDDDDDDAEEMEGVDDQWTEDSASQSPNTTRDNTRSNTRNNSVILDPEENPYKNQKDDQDEPSDTQQTDQDEHQITQLGGQVKSPVAHDFASPPAITTSTHARKSSYHDSTAPRPPDAEAIAKRLLQRGSSRQFTAPKLSDVSATAYAEHDTKSLTPRPISATPSPDPGRIVSSATGSAPIISRFIDPSTSQPGSKDGTPLSPSHMRPTSESRPPTSTSSTKSSPNKRGDRDATSPRTLSKSDMRRNQSVPSFGLSNGHYGHETHASGATTPGGPYAGGRRGETRTQQKLWLQRGLSNIEANSQSQRDLAGMVTPGGRRVGAAMQQAERVERELACVRRYRSVVEEGLGRVGRKGDGREVRDAGKADGYGRASMESRKGRSGANTPANRSVRGPSPVGSGRSFNEGEEWDGLRLEELEEATLEVRRRMWELQGGDMED